MGVGHQTRRRSTAKTSFARPRAKHAKTGTAHYTRSYNTKLKLVPSRKGKKILAKQDPQRSIIHSHSNAVRTRKRRKQRQSKAVALSLTLSAPWIADHIVHINTWASTIGPLDPPLDRKRASFVGPRMCANTNTDTAHYKKQQREFEAS